MISYYVYLKDYKENKRSLVGVLPERRNIPRDQTPTQAGLTWAKKFYHHIMPDPQAIFVNVKKEDS